MQEISTWAAPLSALFISVGKAVFILVIGIFFAGWAGRLARERAHKVNRIDRTLAGFIASGVRYVVMILVLLVVLQTFGVQMTSIVAVLGAATLAIGLALQGTLSHLAAGVMLILIRPYKFGDFVEIAGRSGTVAGIGLFRTDITTVDNVVVSIPNGDAWSAGIVNYSAHDRRRCDLRFGISYDDDMDKAAAVIRRVVDADERFLQDPEPWIRVVNLGDSSVDLELRAWAKASDLWEARFATIKAVKQAFDAEGISIPYPHRQVIARIEKEAPAAEAASG